MKAKVPPFSAEWHALGREAALAAEQLASGATLLGKANHAQNGLYLQAFLGLSLGLERVAKLVAVADYAIENHGRFPNNNDLKNRFGHQIDVLLNYCDQLSIKWRNGKEYSERPNLLIHKGIVETLTEFAKLSRYYNLDLIIGREAKQIPEPIGAWWQRVGQPILQKHYTKRQREKDEAQGKIMHALLGGITIVMHHDEQEKKIDNLEAKMIQTGATRIVQKYGRLYTLQIVRWLAFLITDLSHIGAYQHRIEPLLGLDEYFGIFMNNDAYLKDRKTWSIYRL
ncbi:MAG: hypothetical protein L6277_16360 [Desulfobacterales bacterium]|nr:hypothetical protein [Pseudomonadota bacterium]MBU4356158.1 hypothetical protein [Pseudomonadota bacterium]MCG2773645.1 hypothetical protein [Desulfobacterales bacterium]